MSQYIYTWETWWEMISILTICYMWTVMDRVRPADMMIIGTCTVVVVPVAVGTVPCTTTGSGT